MFEAKQPRFDVGDIENILSASIPWENLSGTRVIVTGASGFLGSWMVRSLLALNRLQVLKRPVEVSAFVRNRDNARHRLSDVWEDLFLDVIEWDFNSIQVPDVPKCQYAIHAASQASPRFYAVDPIGTFLPNAIGTASLLRAIQTHRDVFKGFVFVSSSEVYGQTTGSEPLQEDRYGSLDPTNIRACYAEGKRAGESICIAWMNQQLTPVYIVRPFHTYGPGLLPNDGRVFSDFVFNIVNDENIFINSDGSARRAYCYVTDAIKGLFTVLLTGKAGLPYNVGNPAGNLSVRELAELLIALYPEKNLKIQQANHSRSDGYLPSQFSCLLPDIKRLTSLGWYPEVDPKEGFRRMIEAYKE